MKMFTKTPVLSLLFIIAAIFISQSAHAQTKPWVAPATAQAFKNPVSVTPSTLKEAKTLYMANCSPCHGQKGKGDGPAAAALNPKPADHTSPALNKETDGSLFWKISEGRSPMPQYKNILTETQRWELVKYIRSLSNH
ncbi:MAG: c-type cytochrome [Mucilaginibacter sp.]